MAQYLSIASVIVAILALYRNYKGDNKEDAGILAMVVTKLETIKDDTKEIKSDMKDVRADIDRINEENAINKAEIKSCIKRIDYLQGLILDKTKE